MENNAFLNFSFIRECSSDIWRFINSISLPENYDTFVYALLFSINHDEKTYKKRIVETIRIRKRD